MDEAQLKNFETKIAALENEVFSLRSELERAKRENTSAAANQTVTAAAPVAAAKTELPIPQAAPAVAVKPAPAQPAAVPAPTAGVPVAAHDASFSWEWLIGGNIIGKIGIVTLIISTALFMVYALDQGWLSEWIRLIMLQAAFAALGYLSYRLYLKNYKYVPEILAITALAANTIAIYSAHFVYRFLSRSETMAMMFAVMVIALAFARRIKSAALTMILFGGFFALPVIHSRGINEPKAYFAYLLAVNVLYFVLQSLQSAKGSAPHSFWVLALGNAVSVFGWAGAYNQYATTPVMFCAITLAVMLYAAHRAAWSEGSRGFFHPASVIFVNLLYVLMISTVVSLNKDFSKEVIALAILCQAAINYLVMQFSDTRSIASGSLVVILLMTIGIAITMEGAEEKLAIAALLTAAMYVAGRFNDSLLYFGVLIANAINFIALLVELSHGSERMFILNFQAAGFMFYAVATILLRFKKVWPTRFNFGPILTGVALLSSFVGIISELQRVVTGKESRLLMITLVFAAYAMVLLVIGFRQRKVWFRQAGLFFMGLAIAKFYLIDIWQWDKSVRIIAGIIMGGGLVLISFYYEKFRSKFKEMGLILVLTGIALPSGDAVAAEKFKPNRFKFVKELAPPADGVNGKNFGSTVIDAELYKSAGETDLRLSYDGKVLPYARRVKKTGDDKKVEKDIATTDLVTSVDGENTSIYIFENKDRIRMSALKLTFKEKDYTREVLVYTRSGRFQNNTLAKSTTLTRKAGKPEFHLIEFEHTSGEMQVQVKNEDDPALTLEKIAAVSEKELLIFRVPEGFSDSEKKILVFYGGEYAQKPKYDIGDSLGDNTALAEFGLGAEKANPQYKLTLFDPPYSIWMFRTIFWLLLILIAWRMLAIYRKEKSTNPASQG